MPTFSLYVPSDEVELNILFKDLSKNRKLGDFVIECVKAVQNDMADIELKRHQGLCELWQGILARQEIKSKKDQLQATVKEGKQAAAVKEGATTIPQFWLIGENKYFIPDYRLFVSMIRDEKTIEDIKAAFEKSGLFGKYPDLSADHILSDFQKDYNERFRKADETDNGEKS